jgi:hypothetical protein
MAKSTNYFTGGRVQVLKFGTVGGITILAVDKRLRVWCDGIANVVKIGSGL